MKKLVAAVCVLLLGACSGTSSTAHPATLVGTWQADTFTMTISPTGGVRGFDGCNGFTSTAIITGTLFTLTNGVTTMRACPPSAYTAAIVPGTLGQTRQFAVTDTTLTLATLEGEPLATFTRQP